MTTKKKNKKKIFIIISAVIVCILLLLVLAVWILLKSYLGKIDYDEGVQSPVGDQVENTLSEEEFMQGLLAEEGVTDEADSPKEEIAELEAKMEQHVVLENEEEKKDVFNILLIGIDSRTKNEVGRSDAIVLVSVNENTEKIHVTSIMRDCYVSIPGKSNNRINVAYPLGGGSLLLDTVESNFAVDVDKYVTFDFYSFVDIVDIMGGLEIDVDASELDTLNEYIKEMNWLNGRDESTYQLTQGGLQLLNGTQVLGYTRNRYAGNSDFDRTARQRVVIEKLVEKVKTMNLLEMNELLNTFLPMIKTNLSEEEILSLMWDAVAYLQYDMDSFRIPVGGSFTNMRVNGMAVLGIDLEKNQDALTEYINQ